MLTATFLQIFGLIYLAMGLAFVVHPGQIQASLKAIFKNDGLCLCIGFMAMLMGATIIVLHSRWGTPEEILISVIGWLAFFKGLVYAGFPEVAEDFSDGILDSAKTIRFLGGLVALLGAGLYIVGVL